MGTGSRAKWDEEVRDLGGEYRDIAVGGDLWNQSVAKAPLSARRVGEGGTARVDLYLHCGRAQLPHSTLASGYTAEPCMVFA